MIKAWGTYLDPTVILFVVFYVGVGLRFFVRAVKAYRSPLRNYPSRWAFIKTNWDVFLVRAILFDTPLFVLWIFHPDLAVKGLLWLNVPAGIANWVIVPPTILSAGGFGSVVDLGVDQVQVRITNNPPSWLPDQLKGEIPSYDVTALDINKMADKRGSNPESKPGE
jgi:hypothetical protein